eukprot:scaffold33895_cov19-Prasinocladus_malaysianus.AAC.1
MLLITTTWHSAPWMRPTVFYGSMGPYHVTAWNRLLNMSRIATKWPHFGFEYNISQAVVLLQLNNKGMDYKQAAAFDVDLNECNSS